MKEEAEYKLERDARLPVRSKLKATGARENDTATLLALNIPCTLDSGAVLTLTQSRAATARLTVRNGVHTFEVTAKPWNWASGQASGAKGGAGFGRAPVVSASRASGISSRASVIVTGSSMVATGPSMITTRLTWASRVRMRRWVTGRWSRLRGLGLTAPKVGAPVPALGALRRRMVGRGWVTRNAAPLFRLPVVASRGAIGAFRRRRRARRSTLGQTTALL